MLSIIAAIAFFANPLQQPTGPSVAELAAMKKLHFLVGKWEGTGWIQQGPQRQETKGTEQVQVKLQGKALLVEGLFADVANGKVVHETMAVVTYDEKASKYRFNTYLYNRPNAEYELVLKDNGVAWQMKVGEGMFVDFTMGIDKGDWLEIGEVTMPGRPKMKFLEMRLKKLN
jgi:hypothetical protein